MLDPRWPLEFWRDGRDGPARRECKRADKDQASDSRLAWAQCGARELVDNVSSWQAAVRVADEHGVVAFVQHATGHSAMRVDVGLL